MTLPNMETLQQMAQRHPLITGVRSLGADRDVALETALVYPDGDAIMVYLSAQAGLVPALRLTDHGQTMAWLYHAQIKPWTSPRRKALLAQILSQHGVAQEGGALEIPLSGTEGLPQAAIQLAQACLRASDLVLTRRIVTQASFKEEVEELITDFEIPYEADVQLAGVAGRLVPVDYLVRSGRLTSAVLALSTGSRSVAHTTSNEAFSRWYDLRERAEQRVTLFDDRNDVFRDEDLRRLRDFSQVVPFSEHQTVRDLLTAA